MSDNSITVVNQTSTVVVTQASNAINVVNQTASVVVTPVDGPKVVVQQVSTPSVTVNQNTSSVVVTTQSANVNVSNVGIQGPPGSRLVELVLAITGRVPLNKTYRGYIATAPITLIPADALAVAGTANSVDTTITVTTLTGSVAGVILFPANSLTGTVTLSTTTLTKGQGLIYSTDAAVGTLADILVSIPANRG